jgi:hypothetical protein
MKRRIRNIFGLLALTAGVAALTAAPALAGPSLDVTLERDEIKFPEVHHSDERVDLTVTVRNAAPKTESVPAGTTLTCEGGQWTQEESSGFALSFEWLSDGAPATGPATQIGPRTSTYETQAADEGRVLQCVVKAHDDGGAGMAASFPLGPSSAPTYSGSGYFRPNVFGAELSPTEQEFTCEPPAADVWTGSPSWSYQWLRNGVEIPGATGSTYIAATGSGEPDHLVALQCEVTGENASGAIVTISNGAAFTGNFDEFINEYGAFPPINEEFGPSGTQSLPVLADLNSTAGPITLEVELPGGLQTFAYKTAPSSWDCDKIPASAGQPARVVCSPEGNLPPGEEFPPLEVIVGLGADAPDTAVTRATVFGGGTPLATDELVFPILPAIPFGLSKFTAALLDEAGEPFVQAGGHPHQGVSEIVVNQKRALQPILRPFLPIEQVKQVIVDVPRGIVGNALALPELCQGVDEVRENECSPKSAVGGINIKLPELEPNRRIYAIEPPFGVPAQFAFTDGLENVYTFSPRLRAGDGYAVSLELAPAPEVDFLESKVTLCDFGVVSVGSGGTVCKEKTAPDANPKPLFTNPTRCGVPLTTRVRLDSWDDSTFVEGPPFANATIEGCDKVPFEPTSSLQPTSNQADSPTGLDIELSMPPGGLEDPDGISQSHLRQAKVFFPEGMAVNASAGQGLRACSADQIKLGTNQPISCPESSKVGTVEIETPVIDDTLEGHVYVANQGDVEGSLVGFYLVFDSPENGILVKLPARVDADPQTGRLVATVAESPEQPFSAVRMHLPGGPRATLITPPRCGTYEIVSQLTPWSGGATVTQTSSFQVDQGPNGGPCPSGTLDIGFNAGVTDPVAGKTSPFTMRLHRPDGSQRFSSLELRTPPGLTAYLRGIPYCPDNVLAAISGAAGTGLAQISSPSCPAASQIGDAIAGAGAGAEPFFLDTGRAYLAGPYKGAPLSLALVAPVVAGPLDLGNVVVRTALHINPETAEISAVSDPIPSILHGILTNVRDIRVELDRPHFVLNPTNCEAKTVGVTVHGTEGGTASRTAPFRVDGCAALPFEPRLSTRLFGGTERGDHPRLRAVLRAKPGHANIGRTAVTLPRSEFLDQGHIRTICTRVQFAADACPKGAIYGHAKATTPLLDQPLSGPVYMRSSDNELPDLVVVLRGPAHQPIEAHLVGRIDSIRGGIRTTFESPPDVPVSKFVLSMQGGKKGLLINSRDVCEGVNRLTVRMLGQNGKPSNSRPVLRNGRCGKPAGGKG